MLVNTKAISTKNGVWDFLRIIIRRLCDVIKRVEDPKFNPQDQKTREKQDKQSGWERTKTKLKCQSKFHITHFWYIFCTLH